MGDFNETPDGTNIKFITQDNNFTDIITNDNHQNNNFTFKKKKIDYIFFKNENELQEKKLENKCNHQNISFSITDCECGPKGLSDHCSLICQLKIQKQNK